MTSCHYDKKFYETNYPDSKTSAQIVLNHVLNLIPGVESAVDVGCGTGVWLSVLKEKGVKTIQGYDGNWVLNAEALAIPRECLLSGRSEQVVRGRQEIRPGHLHGGGRGASRRGALAARFVRSLTRLSDIVLFSAAVPGQGGTNHSNEQWPSYWSNLFRNTNFEVVGVLRGMIWDDVRVPPTGTNKNILLFLNVTTRSDLIESLRHDCKPPLCVIHPELYSFKDRFFLINIMDAEISAEKTLSSCSRSE